MNIKGLTKEEVNIRKSKNLVNYDATVKTKTIPEIIIIHIFTLFNILNFSLALAVFIFGNVKNLLFMGIVICNTSISIIQEIRSKKAVDKLSVISSLKVDVIRNSKKEKININEIVLDDILSLDIGNQIVTDSKIVDGIVEVNESYITGEANVVVKRKGDMLLSGSFIVSGSCFAKVIHIGDENYTNKISKQAKYIKRVNSEILKTLNKIIKWISILIIPLGILMLFKQLSLSNLNNAVINTVAAIISMIPEGLILLTSTVLTVSVLRLSKEKVLVQSLYCIETLARIDTLCLDKTGTITEGSLEVIDVINIEHVDYEEILSAYTSNINSLNSTMSAIKKEFKKKNNYIKINEIPFSSERKFSAVSFKDKGTYIIGAPEVVLKDKKLIDKFDYLFEDNRVLLLCHTNSEIKNYNLPKDIKPLSFILLKDKIRKNAKKIIEYFYSQGVDIKIISGDSVKSIESVAHRVGIKGKSISVREHANFHEIVESNSIFGRVNPDEKQQLIKALKKNHVVAYLGDGVNDVLALKESDCAIALKNGSDAAINVAEIVLLDSDFNHLPSILYEGRKTINNITRSASLFLCKTIYSCLLLVIFLFANLSYPFVPIHITLMSAFTIGVPSFILALEPNKEKVKGNFLINILSTSFPTSLTIVFNIVLIGIISCFTNHTDLEISTLSVILTGVTSFMLLYRISKPLNKLRTVLFLGMILLFSIGVIGFRELFSLCFINLKLLILTIILILVSLIVYGIFTKLFIFITKKYPKIFN